MASEPILPACEFGNTLARLDRLLKHFGYESMLQLTDCQSADEDVHG